VILYGRETEQAILTYGIGSCPREVIQALGETKLALLSARQEIYDHWDLHTWGCIENTMSKIILGEVDYAFPLPMEQGGAGTSLHMNFNEVLSTMVFQQCGNYLDPLDDFTQDHSTNDVIPTAFTLVLYRQTQLIEQKIVELQKAFTSLEEAYRNNLIPGRTQLQDALPCTMGDVFGSYAELFTRDRWRLNKVLERLRTIPLGGTAIGTGLGCPVEILFCSEKKLRQITGLPLSRSQNLMDEISHSDKYAELSGVYQRIGENLIKVSSDLILYGASFLREFPHPIAQKGSTLMPFKDNPVVLEFVKGKGMSILGEGQKVSMAVTQGQFQLNPYLPFILQGLLNQYQALDQAISAFCERYLHKLKPDIQTAEKHVFHGPALLNSLRSLVPYQILKEIKDEMKEKNLSPDKQLKWIKNQLNLTDHQWTEFLDQHIFRRKG